MYQRKERERERERERIKKDSWAIHEVEITEFLIINFSFLASRSLTLADFVHNLQNKSTISHRMHVGLIKSNPFFICFYNTFSCKCTRTKTKTVV